MADDERGTESEDQDQAVTLPQGKYVVDEYGNIQQVTDFGPAIERFQWEEAHKLIKEWLARGSRERQIDVVGMYILVGIVVVAASWLAAIGVLTGQAIAGFLGAAIGYLLSRAQVGRGE